MPPLIALAGILGTAAVLTVTIYVYGRVRIERERTLQRLVDHGMTPDDLARIVGPDARGQLDRTRGVLLLAVGLAWTVVTRAAGGRAWTLGALPVALGLAYLAVWGMRGRQR